ncbi:hypothetical protein [Dactylosporangium sp. CS-033363]|uniref:hypothetical protein n=1 Tax=Dactylosporangium sp. CS-033363 TaxID=3239935 RepID=UPI003D915DF5
MSPTAWIAVVVSAVAAFVALGTTAVAMAAQNDPVTVAKKPEVRRPVETPTTQKNDGMLEQGGDGHPCVWVDRASNKQALPYRCPLVWDSAKAMTRVPVYREFTSMALTPEAAINHLYREAGAQYFRCHERGARYDFPAQYGLKAARHDWWALTQGDEHPGKWGWVPEVYLLGGADNEPDPGLPVCTDADIALVV